jgi:alpha-tubulin suppressor-like RCC1 family protein
MTTNINIAGVDVDQIYLSRAFFIDRYPELAGTFVYAGLWGWGIDQRVQLGDNFIFQPGPVGSPVQTFAGGANWRQVSATTEYSDAAFGGFAGAIKRDNTLWMWGANYPFGQLGVNSTGLQAQPVQTISGGSVWRQLSVAGSTTSTIKTDNTLWVWGWGSNGQMGNNATTSRSSPVQTISGGSVWKAVSCGGSHIAAIKTDGTLWLWGRAATGCLGNNATLARSSPVQTVSGGTNWKMVTTGYQGSAGSPVGTTLAIKTDGTLWAWGGNTNGSLGLNDTTPRSSPIQVVTGGTTWKTVSAGSEFTAAIKTDGTLWTWGLNSSGQLGDNTTVSKSSPIQTIMGGTNWIQVSLGGTNVISAIQANGSLWLWGNNNYQQMGNNTTINRSSPVQTTPGGYDWTQVSTAQGFVFAIRDSSTKDYLYIPTVTPTTQTVAGTVGVAITSTTALTTTYLSGTVSYGVSPALPSGLSLSSSTGVISGTPVATLTATIYSINAVGSLGGSAAATVTITVT